MLLGKRHRPSMKRTTSITQFSFDLNDAAVADSSDSAHEIKQQNRNSCEFAETAAFLRSCSLCKRRLVSGRDIYMYRGDSAFCSQECREQQIKYDEKKEKKFSLASKKAATTQTTTATTSAHVSAKGKAVAAAV